ncbi:MAG TPA: arginase, partial [Bacteroidia bacterium]|nr:arginase [Bacteroidia bacterium]
MSDIAHYFTPINLVEISNDSVYDSTQIGGSINAFTNSEDFPELEGVDIAVIGVCEDRRSEKSLGASNAPDEVRKFFYQLYPGSIDPKMIDLGNINAGFEVEDTYYALANTIEVLVKKNIIPVII